MKKTLAVILSMLMLVLMAVPTMAAETMVCHNKDCNNFGLNFMTVPPTCTEDGYTVWKCALCGYSTTTDAIPAFGHKYGTYAEVKGDCTHDSYSHAYCAVCGAEDKVDVVKAPGHAWDEGTFVGVSCTVAEHYVHTCTACGDIKIEKVLGGQPYTGHNMKLVSAPESCADKAVEVYECQNPNCDFVSEKAVKGFACADADADGICDVCTNAMPVEEEPHGFYAKLIKWITDLIQMFKGFIDAIKGDSIF